MNTSRNQAGYRGRLAPSPTGLLHLGHARTFSIAARRARQHGGALILRNEDLDPQRCRAEFVAAMYQDLRWLGIEWSEGPDCGGPYTPYAQSERRPHYLEAWQQLRDGGWIYPCTCSRRDLAAAATAPNDSDDEPVYPGRCRSRSDGATFEGPQGVNWRFRVPEGETVPFTDLHLGPQTFVAGKDFGDFVLWRRDDVPAYQLAVAVDDALMGITEVVRGADLLKSTARQIPLLRALGLALPAYYHCELVRDTAGLRMAKRHDAASIRYLREKRADASAGVRGCGSTCVLTLLVQNAPGRPVNVAARRMTPRLRRSAMTDEPRLHNYRSAVGRRVQSFPFSLAMPSMSFT